jgi:hypothetical protein
MRPPSVVDCHLWIGFDFKECFCIARLNPAQMESMSTKDREARKGGIERHRLVILAKGTKAQVAMQLPSASARMVSRGDAGLE